MSCGIKNLRVIRPIGRHQIQILKVVIFINLYKNSEKGVVVSQNTIIFYLPTKSNGILLVMNRLFLLRKYGDHKRRGFVGYKNHFPVCILLLRYFIYRQSASNLQTKNSCIHLKTNTCSQADRGNGRQGISLTICHGVRCRLFCSQVPFLFYREDKAEKQQYTCMCELIHRFTKELHLPLLEPFCNGISIYYFVNFLFKKCNVISSYLLPYDSISVTFLTNS